MTHRSDPLFECLAPPDPSPELRQRALAAAREALRRAESPDIWTRIWNSRPVQLGWAASVGALLFGHIVIGGVPPAESAFPAMPLAAATGANPELAEVADSGRLTVSLPSWEVDGQRASAKPVQKLESEDRS